MLDTNLHPLLGSLESAFLVSTIKWRLLACQIHQKVVLEQQQPNCIVKTGFQAHLQGGTHFDPCLAHSGVLFWRVPSNGVYWPAKYTTN
jgi:hypothetical protein